MGSSCRHRQAYFGSDNRVGGVLRQIRKKKKILPLFGVPMMAVPDWWKPCFEKRDGRILDLIITGSGCLSDSGRNRFFPWFWARSGTQGDPVCPTRRTHQYTCMYMGVNNHIRLFVTMSVREPAAAVDLDACSMCRSIGRRSFSRSCCSSTTSSLTS